MEDFLTLSALKDVRRFPFSWVVMHLMGPILKSMPIFKNLDAGIEERDRRLGIKKFIMCILYFVNISMKEWFWFCEGCLIDCRARNWRFRKSGGRGRGCQKRSLWILCLLWEYLLTFVGFKKPRICIFLSCKSITYQMATTQLSNLDRAAYRAKCRNKLSDHIRKVQLSRIHSSLTKP